MSQRLIPEYRPQDVRRHNHEKYCDGREITSNNKGIYTFRYGQKDDDASKVQLSSNTSRFVNYLLNKR